MKRLFPLSLALTLAAPVIAQLNERDLATAAARPPAGARLPADLPFTTADGRRVTLGQVAGGRPLVLLFADYTCPHICGPGLVMTASALRRSGASGYRFAVIGLDPRDTAEDARRFAGETLPRPVLLMGAPESVERAAQALGYGYVRDPAAGQYAHDASLYVFAADGRLTALLPELALRPPALAAALSGQGAPKGWTSRVARLCYGFGSAHGRYGRVAFIALQIATVLTVAGLALALWRRRRAA